MSDLSAVKPPQPTGYTIYSKSGCINCTKAKVLIESAHVIDCDDYLIEDKPTFLKYMDAYSKVEPRTFPMIFYNAEFVGGFTEAKIHYEKNNCFTDLG
jgi:glutaredoxin